MFEGSNVAIVTPFTADGGAVDFDALKALIEWHIESGTAGIVPAGCTGEAATLSHEEQQQVIKFTVETVAGRCRVVAGTGSNNTKEALSLTRFAKEAGADAALVITPYYNKPTPEGQFRHYRAVAEAGLPVMLYNVPGRTGTKILPETVARLRKEVPNIASIKEACGSVDQVSRILSLCDIEVVSGDDALTLPMMAVGASGVVSVLGNLVPAEMSALCAAAAAGDFATARGIHYKLLSLMHAMFLETNPMAIKTALGLVGRMKPTLRMPLCEMPPASVEALKGILSAQGLL